MKVMTRKNSTCLMPLLLFFYLAMSPVALANDTGANLNMVASDEDASLNMLENGGIAARLGKRRTQKEDWRSTPSEEKFDWNNVIKKIPDKIIEGINRREVRQECLEITKKPCQSNPTKSCHQYSLICQPNPPTKFRRRALEVREIQGFLKE